MIKKLNMNRIQVTLILSAVLKVFIFVLQSKIVLRAPGIFFFCCNTSSGHRENWRSVIASAVFCSYNASLVWAQQSKKCLSVDPRHAHVHTSRAKFNLLLSSQ